MRRASALVAFAFVGGLALDGGGYAPVSWGRASVALLGLLALACAAARPRRPGRLGLVAVGGLAALLAWTLASARWSVGPPAAFEEAQRTLVYLAAVAAALLFGEPAGLAAGALAGAALAGAVELAGGETVGYANGLGVLAAVGVLLAAGFLRSRPLAWPALAVAAAALVASGSRGAWLALAVGALAGIALRRPAALAALAAAAALGLAFAPGNDRPAYWRATAAIVADHPALGSGAGTWERGWLRHRDAVREARDAHSLYLEQLAELGPLGLAALLAALVPPLAAARRARAEPLAPFLLAAYATWLAHAAIDWDWELPAVTLAGLAPGVALLLLARGPGTPLPGRAAVAAATVALAVPAAVALAGERALADARAALRENDRASAAREARRAERLLPWSAEALRIRGLAERDPAPLRKAVARDPTLWQAWVDLARLARGPERAAARAEARRLNPLGPR